MADLLFLVILVAFFAVAVVFVHACERIIGPDLEAAASDTVISESEPESAAA